MIYLKIPLCFLLLNVTISLSSNNSDECTLYLAKSSINGAGFGLYTTIPYKPGDVVSNDMSIQIFDCMTNLGPDGQFVRWTHDDYIWVGDWNKEYILAEEVDTNAFPFGALTNFHTYFHNVYPTDHEYNDSLLNQDNPGAGAYSYNSRIFTATQDIEAGQELFSNYGEHWLDDHHFDDVPRNINFRKASRIVYEMQTTIGKDDMATLPKSLVDSLKKIVGWYDQRTASLIPETGQQIQDATIQDIAWGTLEKKSIEWIRSEGKCLDHIYADVSTISTAGRGAFAKRFIAKGELISPMPLLQIMNKTNFTMYELANDKKGKVFATNKPLSHQLLLNYCFSHADSELLLCPSTHAALMNHNSQNPNAMYQWSDWDDTTQEWVKNKSYQDIEEEVNKGLSIDFIATRDIQPNEEIFFDYGPAWEQAWNLHVKNFKPRSTVRQSSYELNQSEQDIKTIFEEPSYAENIMTLCLYHEDLHRSGHEKSAIQYMSDYHAQEQDIKTAYKEAKNLNPDLGTDEYIAQFTVEFTSMDIDALEDELMKHYWPCKVYSRSNGFYLVRMFQSPMYEDAEFTANRSFKFVQNIPRKAIYFTNLPYENDYFMKGVFRHEIRIRDEIFPEAWKNLK